ncbi:Mitosis inhibitor nif1 [Escovopsis weberi]|uniref:Mitosis inhibitor nif1 n=1 Tax=Escovopsis weberi TaxID=150374 RepID=A0A0N0RTD9_ESCWE|nr:Mitosis inhibitor nif1 [Escovopsis weberi]
MSTRPALLDLRSNPVAAAAARPPLRSPRLHVAGEAPPELSPLDAFALQSRLLARQLQESGKDGNRVSRLPPLTMASPLIVQGRSDYFRTISHDSTSDKAESPHARPEGVGFKTELEEAFPANERPQSMHPRMSRVPQAQPERVPDLPESLSEIARGRQAKQAEDRTDYFGARQERSPSPLRSDTHSPFDATRLPAEKDYPVPAARKPKQSSYDEIGLAPPRTAFPQRSSSILTPAPDDEALREHVAGSLPSMPSRILSSERATPAVASFQRSLSAASESSAPVRTAFNFSRPISRAGTPCDLPLRQASSDSQPSFVLADDIAQTPISIRSEAFVDHGDDKTGGSYIYSKFTLPRGKAVQRAGEEEAEIRPQTAPQPAPPLSSSAGFPLPGAAPPSPPTRPSSSSARTSPDEAVSMVTALSRQSSAAGRVSTDDSVLDALKFSSSTPLRPLDDVVGRSSAANEASRAKAPAFPSPNSSATTLRPTPSTRSVAPLASEMTAEEHLAKGIECHENGSLNESTYHLRHAARMNHPTAMLLYALACRHGWGMRPNQREGVEWLRRAADHAKIEMGEDRDPKPEVKRSDIAESKTRKAQFALSIYELGVSHMNGWGIEQDKTLALRCFEIAGNWGDVDALAETGFCYAQGIGCKKNLKLSAKYYRMAEAKGMSMVGNSWIHKAKYRDDDEKEDQKKDRKGLGKSRSRSMFGKKTAS